MAYEHNGFFQPMDTLRDKNQLEELVKGKYLVLRALITGLPTGPRLDYSFY